MREIKRLNQYDGNYYDTYDEKLKNRNYEIVAVPIDELVVDEEYVIESGVIVKYLGDNQYSPVRISPLRTRNPYSELNKKQLELFWTLSINRWEDMIYEI